MIKENIANSLGDKMKEHPDIKPGMIGLIQPGIELYINGLDRKVTEPIAVEIMSVNFDEIGIRFTGSDNPFKDFVSGWLKRENAKSFKVTG